MKVQSDLNWREVHFLSQVIIHVKNTEMEELPMVDADQIYEAVEVAKATGKLKKGSNEVTKALERGTAKLVVVAKDVAPAEIIMHLPLLAKEKGVLCVEVPSKEQLGVAAGLTVGTGAIAIVVEGEAKKLIQAIAGN